MGFFNLDGEIGIAVFNAWLATRSYVESYAPSQADVACFKAIDSSPSAAQHPHAARWYKHLASYETEFSNLPGDATKPYSAYGPEVVGAVAPTPAQDDGEDVDLFGSDDEEDAQAERIRQQRLAEYKTRKATKPKTIAKSVLVLDVKPWDDETDMAALEAAIRGIDRDGLVWGTSKLVSVGYGIKKLQVNVVVEDDKVSTQDLQDEIEGFEEYVQSSDIVTFQKL